MSRQLRSCLALSLVALVALTAACGSGGAGSGPTAVVREAVSLIESKQVDRLPDLACAAERSTIARQFNFAAGLGELIPGVEVSDVLAAVEFDTSKITIAEQSVSGDTATVRMAGAMGVSFDGEKLRDVMKAVAEQQGAPIDDAVLDFILAQLGTLTEEIAVDQALSVVREDGAWKICGEAR